MSEPHIQSGSRRGKLALACFGVAAVAVVITGVLSRQADSEEVATWTQERLIPTVSVVKPTYGVNTEQLDLAGRLQPFRQASIYARVDGYIKSWDHDIGALVKAGDILAELDTPELDEQMMQARADVTRSKADVELADSTVKLWRKLVESNAVTAQELEQRENSYRSAAAALESAEANLRRLEVQKNLASVPAPFDGVVVARNKDTGDLINAGSDDSIPLFRLAATETLRLNVDVPQKFARQMSSGVTATITVPEDPSAQYEGKIVRSNSAVDPQTGTMMVQLLVDNAEGHLLPGSYASVSLPLASAEPMITVPASALIFNAEGLSVAVIDDTAETARVKVVPVTVARDLGRNIEITRGITNNADVISNPPDGIKTGHEVRVVSNSNSNSQS